MDILITHDDGELKPLQPIVQYLKASGFLTGKFRLTHFRDLTRIWYGCVDDLAFDSKNPNAAGDEDPECETYMGFCRLTEVPWCIQRTIWAGHYQKRSQTVKHCPFALLPAHAIQLIIRFIPTLHRRIDMKSYMREHFAFAVS